MPMLEYDLQRLAEEFGKEPNSSNQYTGWTIYLMLMGLLSSTREEISSIQEGPQELE